MMLILLTSCFLMGTGVAIMGLVLWGIFDVDCGSTIAKVGIVMMVAPICIGIIALALTLLVCLLFGVAIVF